MSEDFSIYTCDLCGADNAEEISVARNYTGGQSIHVCRSCGFIYVRRRRSAQMIADVWSKEIFQKGYTARIPAVKARQTYVAEFIDSLAPLAGRTVCDIGGGEGQFLDIIRSAPYGAKVFAIEPSQHNCEILSDLGIEHFLGTVEDFLERGGDHRFDLVTIMWTLENCESCRRMMDAAWLLLKPGGIVCVATGSRILVPFKKPLHLYLSRNPVDSHCFRFSSHSLKGILALSGFENPQLNRYIDTDYLVALARKREPKGQLPWKGDDWQKVQDFFNRWDQETSAHYPIESDEEAE